ncbi:uncharacterized protein RJT20DRAFT_131653 [Scheffersomyces xylosifermentans]|uniref:uncharacterized protein n=1 Tax=Scheffersomyces xylosifermentans TaxID=1304137 RepID=UPI00315C99A6
MNLFKIILIFTTLAVQYTIAAVWVTDPESISFYNQSQFEIVRSRIDECNHRLNTSYTLVASSYGTWLAITYDNRTAPETELEDAFMDCVDPFSIYPLGYAFRTADMSSQNDNEIQESTDGPDALGILPSVSETGWFEDLDEPEGSFTPTKRLAAQDYWFWRNMDLGGNLVWHGSANNKNCITIRTNPSARSFAAHRFTFVQSTR